MEQITGNNEWKYLFKKICKTLVPNESTLAVLWGEKRDQGCWVRTLSHGENTTLTSRSWILSSEASILPKHPFFFLSIGSPGWAGQYSHAEKSCDEISFRNAQIKLSTFLYLGNFWEPRICVVILRSPRAGRSRQAEFSKQNSVDHMWLITGLQQW